MPAGGEAVTDWRMMKIPVELVERAGELGPKLTVRTSLGVGLGGGLGGGKWTATAVSRLALDWGLGYLEACMAAGAPLVPPAGPVRGVGVGDEVEFRDGVNDSDGRVLEVAPGGRCLVAWDSGVKLWHDADEVAGWVAAGFVHAAG